MPERGQANSTSGCEIRNLLGRARVLAGLLLLYVAAPASAQLCSDTSPLASYQGSMASGVLLAAGPGGVKAAMGSQLSFLDPATLGLAELKFQPDEISAVAAAELEGGLTGVFTSEANGILRAFDGTTYATLWPGISLIRSGCINDTLRAAPLVHRIADATPAFEATYGDDLVYVVTAYASSGSCTSGHDTDNKVYAVGASDGLVEWTFNISGTHDVDVVVGMALDPVNDRLYVTTDRTFSTSQDSIWALNVLTGSLAWSANAGRLFTAPVLRDGRLYVTAAAGTVSAYEAVTGTLLWTSPGLGAPLAADQGGNPVVIARPDGEVWIAAVDFAGTVHVVRDDDTSATVLQSIALPGTTGETRDTLVADAQGRAAPAAETAPDSPGQRERPGVGESLVSVLDRLDAESSRWNETSYWRGRREVEAGLISLRTLVCMLADRSARAVGERERIPASEGGAS